MFEQDVHEAIKIFFNTIKACIQNESNNQIKILRLTLSFVRKLLNLDNVLAQFIEKTQFTDIELAPNTVTDHNLSFNDFKQIAANTLIAVICKYDCSKFNFNNFNTPINSVSMLKCIATIEKLSSNDEKIFLELIQARILLYFLSGDIEKMKEFIEELLLPDYLIRINFDTSFKFEQKNLERSFFILYIQLMLHEYIRMKTITFGTITLNHLRNLVNRAREIFPGDPIFLVLTVIFETKFTILSKTRKIFKNYISNSPDKIRNYFIQRYINHSNCSPMDEVISIDSLYNIFMAGLHFEFLSAEKFLNGKFIHLILFSFLRV